jgi:hypothetical protein
MYEASKSAYSCSKRKVRTRVFQPARPRPAPLRPCLLRPRPYSRRPLPPPPPRRRPRLVLLLLLLLLLLLHHHHHHHHQHHLSMFVLLYLCRCLWQCVRAQCLCVLGVAQPLVGKAEEQEGGLWQIQTQTRCRNLKPDRALSSRPLSRPRESRRESHPDLAGHAQKKEEEHQVSGKQSQAPHTLSPPLAPECVSGGGGQECVRAWGVEE